MTEAQVTAPIVTLGVASLTQLLREAEDRHGLYEPTAPKHHWSDWYACYMIARKRGRTIEEAERAAALHMAQLRAAPVPDEKTVGSCG